MPTSRSPNRSSGGPRAGPPHLARAIAESFGADPERYDRTRPRYPSALIDRIVAAIPGVDVLDVGVGTGVCARQFQAAGCRVLGVEVDPRMAAFARAHGVAVQVARFEDWEPAGRTFDAVVAGQTWHWIDPVKGAAHAAELLGPGGCLALFWNVMRPPEPLAQAFAAVYRRVLPDSPLAAGARDPLPAYERTLATVTAGIQAAGASGTAERWRWDWNLPYTREQWLDQLPTFGGHSRLSPATSVALADGIGDAIDALGGAFTMAYVTVAVVAARAGGSGCGAGLSH